MRAKCLFTFNFRLLFNVFKRFDALNYNHFGIHFIIQSDFFIILIFFRNGFNTRLLWTEPVPYIPVNTKKGADGFN